MQPDGVQAGQPSHSHQGRRVRVRAAVRRHSGVSYPGVLVWRCWGQRPASTLARHPGQVQYGCGWCGIIRSWLV